MKVKSTEGWTKELKHCLRCTMEYGHDHDHTDSECIDMLQLLARERGVMLQEQHEEYMALKASVESQRRVLMEDHEMLEKRVTAADVECARLRGEVGRLKEKLIVEDDQLCGINAKLEHENAALRSALIDAKGCLSAIWTVAKTEAERIQFAQMGIREIEQTLEPTANPPQPTAVQPGGLIPIRLRQVGTSKTFQNAPSGLLVDGLGELWLKTQDGLYRVRDGKAEFLALPEDGPYQPLAAEYVK